MDDRLRLKDRLYRVAVNYNRIYIRALKDGKWGNYALGELDDKTVSEWIINKILD